MPVAQSQDSEIERILGSYSEALWRLTLGYCVSQADRQDLSLDLGLNLAVRATAESSMVQAERRQLLMDAIRGLEGIDKQVVLLYLEEFDNAEIADVVGLSEGAVATRLSRLRARLAERIAGRAGAK